MDNRTKTMCTNISQIIYNLTYRILYTNFRVTQINYLCWYFGRPVWLCNKSVRIRWLKICREWAALMFGGRLFQRMACMCVGNRIVGKILDYWRPTIFLYYYSIYRVEVACATGGSAGCNVLVN